MVLLVPIALVALKAAAPHATSLVCGHLWGWIGQAGSLLGGALALSKHIDQTAARESQMALETKRFDDVLALVRSKELSIDEKVTVDNMEQQIKNSHESLQGRSWLVSTEFRFAAHMTAMREVTADLHEMLHAVTTRRSRSRWICMFPPSTTRRS